MDFHFFAFKFIKFFTYSSLWQEKRKVISDNDNRVCKIKHFWKQCKIKNIFYNTLPFKSLGSVRNFLKKFLMLTKATFIWSKHCEILLQFKITVFCLNIFENVIYSCDGKAAIIPVFSVTQSY